VDALSATPRPWTVRQLGRQPFERVWRAMATYTDTRGDHGGDELWRVEPDSEAS